MVSPHADCMGSIRRRFLDTSKGQIHYAECGKGEAVLFLHQTPRSWDEFREVLPIIGKDFRALAMDTVGFGDSYALESEPSIERYAEGVIDFMDGLSLRKASLVGHHTGGVIAVEVAASHPDRVDRIVLSSTPFVDAEDRRRRETRPPIDHAEIQEDGSHLIRLWEQRRPFYPTHRPDLLNRFIMDALKTEGRTEAGHAAVGRYRMEAKILRVRSPVCIISGTEDPFARVHLSRLAENIRGVRIVEIPGGKVPLPDQMPQSFADAVLAFLRSTGCGESGCRQWG